MTPTLADTLQALARALPMRVMLVWRGIGPTLWIHSCRVKVDGMWVPCLYSEGVALANGYPVAPYLHLIEYALREECEARGWPWKVQRSPSGAYGASVLPRPAIWAHNTMADTAAHALALALLSALHAAQAAAMAAERQQWPESPLDVPQ